MQNQRLMKKHKKLYDEIEDLYRNKLMSITQACKKKKISVSTYYYICKKLNKDSVVIIDELARNTEYIKKMNTSVIYYENLKNKKDDDIINQNAGNLEINCDVNNIHEFANQVNKFAEQYQND